MKIVLVSKLAFYFSEQLRSCRSQVLHGYHPLRDLALSPSHAFPGGFNYRAIKGYTPTRPGSWARPLAASKSTREDGRGAILLKILLGIGQH